MTGIEEFAIIIGIAAVFGVIIKILKQPLILAYLLTGVFIAVFGIITLDEVDIIKFFSQLGVMFLLFLVGMEMDYGLIKKVGKVSLMIGLGQVVFTFLGGLMIAMLGFGFDLLPASYIAIALTFSSTVIIVKLLSDKKAINSLHGRIAVGLLLVQDFVVVIILIVLNALSPGEMVGFSQIGIAVLQGIALFALMILLGSKIFPKIFGKIAYSQELLFLGSLAWLLVFTGVVVNIGFSVEISGFLAGLALANSSHKFHIASRIKPLRDFFLLIFFVWLGSMMTVPGFEGLIVPIIVFSLFVLIGNPFIVMMIMRFMGYKKRTNFLTGTTVAQISEFSMIMAMLGLTLGHIAESHLALIAGVGLVTITLSTYLIIYSEKIYEKISSFLSVFEGSVLREDYETEVSSSKSIILIGGHRMGTPILSRISKEKIMVIDFDPVVVDRLKKRGYDCLFADMTDAQFLESIDLSETKLIVSTSPNLQDNVSFIRKIKEVNSDIKIIVRANDKKEVEILYSEKADYVIFPYFSSGQYIGKAINGDLNLNQLKNKDLEILRNY